MKKLVGAIFVCTLLMISVIAGSTSVNNNKMNENVVLFEDGVISTSIPIGDYEIESLDEVDIVTVEDFGRLLIPGNPDLPTKIFAIAIPPGSEFVDLTYDLGEGIVLSGEYNILPVPLPQVIGKEDPFVRQNEEQTYYENYENTYSSDIPYPGSIVEFERKAGFRKYNLVDVRINPVTYEPISGKLTYYPDITVHVSYNYPKSFNPSEIMFDEVASFEQKASEFILNHDETIDWYPPGQSGRNTYDYVIITLDSLTSSVTDLSNWEEAKGRSVKVVTTSWINSNYNGYDDAEKIRNFLRDKYPSNEWGIEYVCLVGDYDDVKIRRTSQNTGYGQPETDFYHAELSYPDSSSWDADGDHQYGENSDPIDFYAEVYVGRIPWSTASTVEDICEKTVAYEQNNDDSFKKNILLLGAFFWPDTDNAVLMEYKTDDSIHPWMSDWTMTKMYEQGQSSYPMDYNLDYNNVESVWSQGTYAFVDWAGHGSPTACYEYYPSQAFVDTTTCTQLNDDYPSIIFADACSNSDTDDDNIGQMMLKQGGVGFLGATKVAYGMHAWNNPYSGSSQSMDYFFTIGCTEGILTMGESHQLALQEMYENNLWYYQKYEHFQWGALWGNPDLTMGPVTTSAPPAKPILDGPDEGVYNQELTFTAVTTEPDGEQVFYLFDWGDGETSDWLGPYDSGVTIEAIHSWTGLGSFYVKVKAKDINSANSEWSDEHRIDITDNTKPEAPVIDGPNTGKVGIKYLYTVSADDVDEHDVCFLIDWGDGETTDWSDYYPCGEEAVFTHTFAKTGTLTIQVRAMDTIGYKSDWTTLEVTMPRSRSIQNPLILHLLDKISNIFPILDMILSNIW